MQSGTVGERIVVLERLAGEIKQEMLPEFVNSKIFVCPIEQGVVRHMHDNADVM